MDPICCFFFLNDVVLTARSDASMVHRAAVPQAHKKIWLLSCSHATQNLHIWSRANAKRVWLAAAGHCAMQVGTSICILCTQGPRGRL